MTCHTSHRWSTHPSPAAPWARYCTACPAEGFLCGGTIYELGAPNGPPTEGRRR